ncbi:hypothetical protein PMAYCL1PPCAC_08700, partial [Pristionchus mayeri]
MDISVKTSTTPMPIMSRKGTNFCPSTGSTLSVSGNVVRFIIESCAARFRAAIFHSGSSMLISCFFFF